MARRLRASQIETRTARLKLTPRLKPYHFTIVSRGIAIGYRRNRGPGTWVMRAADGKGSYWTKAIGFADDHEDADGSQVLDFFQAQDRARTLVRGKDTAADKPMTVSEAVDSYERDLAARGGIVANLHYARRLLVPTLLAKPVALLESKELRRWRDSLLGTRKAASVNRILKSIKAALTLAATHDPRIGNSAAWRAGLAGLPDAETARHIALPDADVRALVAAAYTVDSAFGLWTEVAATTGARPVQLNRLEVADLQDDRGDPRLLMPSSRKGRGNKRIARKPVPIPASLARKLRHAATGKALTAPLLANADGTRRGRHGRLFARVATAAGLESATAYSLRHSSIIRALLAGVPARVVAATHDTSILMIERNYSAHIADHSDAISRAVLLDLDHGSIFD